MLAYYFYHADVKNLLWTVIFSINLTDDRSLCLGFHGVCARDERKTDVMRVCESFFISLVGFYVPFQGDVVLMERKPLGDILYILVFSLGGEAQCTDENE